jgi:asparagine synthase (glutamine-hydrolysing)
MCGIIGVVTRDGATDWVPALNRGVKALTHRGPDDHGVVVVPERPNPEAPRAVLGNVRLAILDLSPAGHMPMASPDGRVWITYNGELYNFRELRAELAAAGHAFVSTGDTEVVLHAYLEWGEACLPRLNGMFAFAIVDRREGPASASGSGVRCLLARDHLGIKPCYYVERDGTLGFASELKGLAALGLLGSDLDWQAIWDFFSFLYVPGPRTAYAGVRQLPPAHSLAWEPGRPAPAPRRYWSPLAGPEPPGAEGEAAAATELRALLTDAVRRQLVSDVPLGVFLSGGIDSTILTGLAAETAPGALRTFTVTFEGEGIGAVDDRVYARRVSDRYRTDHTELVVDISAPERMFELITAFDQPFANPTFYLSYLISAVTRRHVTVALSGAGGDELFGGYPRYRALGFARWLERVPEPLGRLAAATTDRLLPEDPDQPFRRRLKLFLRGAGQALPEQYLRWTYYLTEAEKQHLLAPAAARFRGVEPSARHLAGRLAQAAWLPDLGTRVQYADLETFLADNVLEYTDRTTMAVSLEARVPFLDPRVVAWSFRRPFREKLASGTTKRLLRRAFGDLIPAENLAAPKRGFCPPLAAWMAGPLDRYFDAHMDQRYVARQGLFDWTVIQALRETHRRRRRDTSMELFGLIMFDVWWRRYVEGGR